MTGTKQGIAQQSAVRRVECRDVCIPPLELSGTVCVPAAALVVAARMGEKVRAVVSRGGRPDLADTALDSVRSPTLLVVGGCDDVVIGLNQLAHAPRDSNPFTSRHKTPTL